MLIYFDKFCKKHNLEYVISFGTALGAVRHGGFIPWDDDVDVDMPVKDYERFAKIWFKEGDKENYFLQTKKTDSCISMPFYRLRKNNTASILPGCENIPIHWGLPIDIFPLYNTPQNAFLKNVKKIIENQSREVSVRVGTYKWIKSKKMVF